MSATTADLHMLRGRVAAARRAYDLADAERNKALEGLRRANRALRTAMGPQDEPSLASAAHDAANPDVGKEDSDA